MIEVLHERDPDGGCSLTVYLDGEPVEVDVLADVDPGRGHEAMSGMPARWSTRAILTTRQRSLAP